MPDTGHPLSRSSSGPVEERLTPNFILLWQSNGRGLHDVIPAHLAGGLRLRGKEGAWEMIGLYHDEDEAFEALEKWQPGPTRADGQIAMAQLSDLCFASTTSGPS